MTEQIDKHSISPAKKKINGAMNNLHSMFQSRWRGTSSLLSKLIKTLCFINTDSKEVTNISCVQDLVKLLREIELELLLSSRNELTINICLYMILRSCQFCVK